MAIASTDVSPVCVLHSIPLGLFHDQNLPPAKDLPELQAICVTFNGGSLLNVNQVSCLCRTILLVSLL